MSKFSNFYENKHTILIKFWSKRPYFKTLTLLGPGVKVLCTATPVHYLCWAYWFNTVKHLSYVIFTIISTSTRLWVPNFTMEFKYIWDFAGRGRGGGMNWLTLPQHLCIGVRYMIIQLLGQIFFPTIWNDRRSRWKVVWRIQDVWCLAYSWDDIVSNNTNK